MKLLRTNLLLFSVLFLAGCTATVENPLVPIEKATRFAELNGTYKLHNAFVWKVSWLHIGFAGKEYPKGFHRLVWVAPGDYNNNELRLFEGHGFFEKINGEYFLHIPLATPAGEQQVGEHKQFPNGWDANKIDRYNLYKFTKSKEGFDIYPLNTHHAITQIESKKLTGEIILKRAPGPVRVRDSPSETEPGKRKHPHIQATPKDLREFLTKEANGIQYAAQPIVAQRQE